MAFLIHSVDDGRVLPWEYLPAESLVPQVGMALKMEGGKLTPASGSDRPQYISMRGQENAVPVGGVIPVVRVSADVVWETELTADGSALVPGDSVTLAADGMGITAAKGGSAEIVALLGKAAGDRVRVRFQ